MLTVCGFLLVFLAIYFPSSWGNFWSSEISSNPLRLKVINGPASEECQNRLRETSFHVHPVNSFIVEQRGNCMTWILEEEKVSDSKIGQTRDKTLMGEKKTTPNMSFSAFYQLATASHDQGATLRNLRKLESFTNGKLTVFFKSEYFSFLSITL